VVQDHAPARVIWALLPVSAGEDEDAQAGEVAVLHGREVDVDLSRLFGHLDERGDQARRAALVKLTGPQQAVRGPGDPQGSVVKQHLAPAGRRAPMPGHRGACGNSGTGAAGRTAKGWNLPSGLCA